MQKFTTHIVNNFGIHGRVYVLFISAFFAGLMLFPSSVFAASLSLDPDSGSYGPGDMFIVTIRLDTTPSECVNAAQVELSYPTDWMKVTAVSKGESLLSLWTEEPRIDVENGRVSFSGGIPAGYCGRVLGDPGKTNILLKLVFTIPGNMIGGKVATGPVPLALTFGSSSSILLNDGFGNPANLEFHNAILERSMVSSGLKNEWLDEVHADNTPPDAFTATVEHNPNMFDGKFFLAFTSIDKQSGIHHFEVREDDPERLDFVRGENNHAEFIQSQSLYYYELSDQELKSRITVRAVDNARNHTDSIIAPLNGSYQRVNPISKSNIFSWDNMLILAIVLVLITLLVVFGRFFYKRKNAQESSENTEQVNHEPPHHEQ